MHKCIDCGTKISRPDAKRCRECYTKYINDMKQLKEEKMNSIKINKKNRTELIKELGSEIVNQFKPLNLFEKKSPILNISKLKEEHSILDISDVHIGMKNEIYDTEEKKQLITYNERIFLNEIVSLKKSIFDIYDILSNSYKLRELTINVMGDIITNDRIFAEQPLEIEYVVGKQIWKAIPVFTEFFNSLLAKYEKINVVCIIGNHGRSMPDFQNEPVENSFEYFIYKTWEKQFEKSKRIKIVVPDTRRYIYNIYGWKHLIEHGDAFRGTTATALERQIEQLYVNMGGFDVFHMGHVHKCKEVEITDKVICKINGSWIPKDSWAFKCFKTYSLPKQHFFGCNPHRPETWSYKLDLRG
jgi:hypothetical protein